MVTEHTKVLCERLSYQSSTDNVDYETYYMVLENIIVALNIRLNDFSPQ